MAITQAMCTSFKVALLDGEMDFSGNTQQAFKIALYTSSVTLSAATTAYATTNEVSGTNYTAGGNTLSIAVQQFLAAQSSFRSLVVGWFVGPSVRPSVREVCEKVSFRVSNGK